jgi:hypothetical protein
VLLTSRHQGTEANGINCGSSTAKVRDFGDSSSIEKAKEIIMTTKLGEYMYDGKITI